MLADKSVFFIAHIYDGGGRWQKKRTRMEGVEADHVGGTIKLTVEPILDGVHDDDRMNVRNVIYLLDALKLCQSWSVTSKDQGYEVLGSVDTKAGKTTEIVLKDLELITKVDPLRVTSAGMRFIGGGALYVVVFVLRRSEPVVLEEQDVVHIRRKRKFWMWGGST